ncbi:MAG: hypothetical protein JO301_15450 [Chitinophagaceae bacterium]|nr:hypothetical protein [Chitinophagaceae bacterium]
MKTLAILFSAGLLLTACSKNGGGGNSGSNGGAYTGPNEPAVFLNSPIEVSKISFLLSLGWIQPVGHTIPTDHVYFWYSNPNNTIYLPVYALTNGRVEKILNVPVLGVKETKTWFRVNEKFMYYLDHIVLDPSIQEGSMVKAGQQIGTTGLGSSIDLGAIDDNITLPGFVNQARYVGQTLHCGKPFTYFTDALKAQLYPMVDREGPDKDGRIDIDVPGRLVGSWFLDGPVLYTDGPDGWDKELSFAFDIQHPQTVLVSIGGTIQMVGKYTIEPGKPLPAEVSMASGKIAYPLYSAGGISADPNQRGLMIIQMIDDTHIKVETFAGSTAKDAAFDANAKIYAR